MQSTSEVKESFRLLVFASLLTLALWFIPFAGVITYPIELFVTLIHESGHAIAALATSANVNRIELYWDGSGLTRRSGGWGLIISSAGYLATMLYGCGLLLALRRARNARVAAIFTTVLVLLITGLFGGNITAFTKLCETARAEAFDIMVQHASEIGANAIIGRRYDANEIMNGVTEVLAYGTAVVVEALES